MKRQICTFSTQLSFYIAFSVGAALFLEFTWYGKLAVWLYVALCLVFKLGALYSVISSNEDHMQIAYDQGSLQKYAYAAEQLTALFQKKDETNEL